MIFLVITMLAKGVLGALAFFKVETLLNNLVHELWDDRVHESLIWDQLQSNV